MFRILILLLVFLLIFLIAFSIVRLLKSNKNRKETLTELEKLQELKNNGTLNEIEFQKAKEKLLKKL